MGESVTVRLETESLPRGELDRLVRRATAALPNVVDPAETPRAEQVQSGGDRNLDPVVVSTLITSGVTVLAPFLAKLAELLFRAESKSTVTISSAAGRSAVLVDSLAPEVRDVLIREAIASGALQVTITVPAPGA